MSEIFYFLKKNFLLYTTIILKKEKKTSTFSEKL